MRRTLGTGAIAALLAGLFTTGGVAQDKKTDQSTEAEQPLTTIQIDVELVNIFCSARTKQGTLVPDLSKDEFKVYEDKKEQAIKYFSKETDLPITMGMLVDVSRSQERLLDEEKRTGAAFFSNVLRKKDLAFVMGFGPEVELVQDYTASPDFLSRGLNQLEIRGGGNPMMTPGPVPTVGQQRGTVLFDAVWLAAREKLRSEVGRKAMIILTDGVDMGSRVSLDDAVEAAQKADAIIYSIYYIDPAVYSGGYGYYGFRPSNSDLKKLSEETGGRLFEVDRKMPLDRVFKEIQDELRSQYAIGYSPTNANKDGTFRKVEIKTTRKDVKVQARKGYYAN